MAWRFKSYLDCELCGYGSAVHSTEDDIHLVVCPECGVVEHGGTSYIEVSADALAIAEDNDLDAGYPLDELLTMCDAKKITGELPDAINKLKSLATEDGELVEFSFRLKGRKYSY